MELGQFRPAMTPCDELSTGQVGYLTASIKRVADAKVGETITEVARPTASPFPGYRDAKPMVFAGLYSIEDTEYARRIALLRTYYFEQAPEIGPYLLSLPPAEQLHMGRVPGDRWQGYRTVAGMVAVITAVLAGSSAALAAVVVFDHSLAAAVIAGTLVALPTMLALIRHQDSTWERTATEPLKPGE